MSELAARVARVLAGPDGEGAGPIRVLLDALELASGPLEPAVAWAAGLLVRTLEAGGTCLVLSDLADIARARGLPEDLARLDTAGWRARLAGPSVGDGSEVPVRPLALVGERLYFDRYARMEARLAAALTAPVGSDPFWSRVAEVAHDDVVARVASSLATRRVHLLSGGPGTGKTTSVAALLDAIERAHGPSGLDGVALVAPTGKAAERLALVLAPATIVDRPRTLHSLLGVGPEHPHRRERAALEVRLVICDETSMVDVALLDELLAALGPECRLLLVGDPDQLQSVELGSVMGDLVAAPALTRTTLRGVRRVEGASARARETLLALFDDVREGRASAVLESLRARGPGVELVALEDGAVPALAPVLDEGLARALTLRRLARGELDRTRLTAVLESVMVLCAQHEGPLGRRWWVERVAERLELRPGPVPEVGTPVLVTRSDRAIGVVNGDTGLVVEHARGPVLRRHGGDAQDVPVATLAHWQPWWAMTIHKAQGSEFDHVVVVIPPGSRLVSRELLYTALTRARARVSVVARPADVLEAVARPVRRSTGLTASITEAAARRIEAGALAQ